MSQSALDRYLSKYSEGSGKPCGDSHISTDKECKIDQGSISKREAERAFGITTEDFQKAAPAMNQAGIPGEFQASFPKLSVFLASAKSKGGDAKEVFDKAEGMLMNGGWNKVHDVRPFVPDRVPISSGGIHHASLWSKGPFEVQLNLVQFAHKPLTGLPHKNIKHNKFSFEFPRKFFEGHSSYALDRYLFSQRGK